MFQLLVYPYSEKKNRSYEEDGSFYYFDTKFKAKKFARKKFNIKKKYWKKYPGGLFYEPFGNTHYSICKI